MDATECRGDEDADRGVEEPLLSQRNPAPGGETKGQWAPTPPLTGFETPSETRTPSVNGTPRDQYYVANPSHEVHHHPVSAEGPMCLDPWDWNPDAPEYLPGSMKGLLDGAWAVAANGRNSGGGGGGGHDGGGQKSAQALQLRAQYDWQLRTRADELRDMQNRMNRLEIETAQMQASWDLERRGLVQQVGRYRAVLERYCIPPEEAGCTSFSDADGASAYYAGFEPPASSQWGAASAGGGSASASGSGAPAEAVSSLDSKMQQLNSLLHEGGAQSRWRSAMDATPNGHAAPCELDAAGEAGAGGYANGSIESTLRTMFPHATIRTSRADGAAEEEKGANPPEEAEASDAASEARAVEQQLRRLERSTGSSVDDRALRTLHGLCPKAAREALGKVEDLVQSQGGHCRNLSSILQSVCKRIEKRPSRGSRPFPEEEAPRAGWMGNGAAATATREAAQATRAAEAAAAAATAGGGPSSAGPAAGAEGSRARRARRLDEDGDAFEDSAGSSEGRAVKDGAPNVLDTPAGKRSWADIQSGDEDDLREEAEDEGEHWTAQRVEKAARHGYELRRRGDHWELRISMGGMDPPLTEAGMQRYCRWLWERLNTFRREHGSEPLRHCRGEVDFSHNRLTNQMVWMLLETLTQNEVHTALLKLFANNISQGGALAICEFIRKNERAEPLQELHLSHNEIDDDSALELLRVLDQHRPRYPPRRPCEGSEDSALAPVWLRLNHNRIQDPEHVRRSAEAEGISICTAWDRQACGTSKCSRRECPLVHLYSFSVQAAQQPRQQRPRRPER